MKRFFKNHLKNKVLIALLVIISFLFLLPQAKVLAQSAKTNQKNFVADDLLPKEREVKKTVKKEKEKTKIYKNKKLPINKDRIKRITTATVTAYNAVPWQTDSTPCITADGLNVCGNEKINVVAANWLPFGTKIKIPEYFGDTVFEVHDRMNKKYSHRIDILMKSIPEAKKFGIKKLKIIILD